jgi:hypothetical protein
MSFQKGSLSSAPLVISRERGRPRGSPRKGPCERVCHPEHRNMPPARHGIADVATWWKGRGALSRPWSSGRAAAPLSDREGQRVLAKERVLGKRPGEENLLAIRVAGWQVVVARVKLHAVDVACRPLDLNRRDCWRSSAPLLPPSRSGTVVSGSGELRA